MVLTDDRGAANRLLVASTPVRDHTDEQAGEHSRRKASLSAPFDLAPSPGPGCSRQDPTRDVESAHRILLHIVGYVCAVAAPDAAGAECYATTAQVIPVLLLVIAVEVRVFRPSGAADPDEGTLFASFTWFTGVLAFGLLTVAEFVSLALWPTGDRRTRIRGGSIAA